VARLLGVLAVLTLGIWALIDIAQTPEPRVRLLSKPVWSLLVLVPLLGAAAWFTQGREPAARPAGSKQPRPLAPDDDPDFLRRLGDHKHPDGP
jgi:Phospholipase_D-nuclease N-terminal